MSNQNAAISSAQVTVETTATQLTQAADGVRTILVRNQATVSVFLGDSTVTTGDGFELEPDEAASVDIPTRETNLFGIVATGTARVDVLEVSYS